MNMGTVALPDLRRLPAALGVILSGLLLTAGAAGAGDVGVKEDPGAFLSRISSQAIEVLADKSLSEDVRMAEFRELFTSGFDVDLISRFVMGRYWRVAKEEERREYRQLYEDFILNTYARRFNGYSGETLDVGAVRGLGQKGAEVSSLIRRTEGPPFKVNWRLRYKDGGWRIVDIVVEGVSLAVSQRSEFTTIINNSGGRVETLLGKLRKKNAGTAVAGTP